jgi:hypothetical protein
MTPYTPDELAHDWEFKIVRSGMGGFRKPQFLQQVLDEESRAGWVLVEKFDNCRIRLKRPATARQRDGKLDFDPYRTQTDSQQILIVALAIAGALTLMAVIGIALAS